LCGKCQNKRNFYESALVLDMESRQFQLKGIRGYLKNLDAYAPRFCVGVLYA